MIRRMQIWDASYKCRLTVGEFVVGRFVGREVGVEVVGNGVGD